MGYRYSCFCYSKYFKVFVNPYNKTIVPFEHLEIVCEACGRGFVVFPEHSLKLSTQRDSEQSQYIQETDIGCLEKRGVEDDGNN